MAALPQHKADAANGQILYNVAGCHSCHKPGPDLKDVDAALPAGGAPLKTPIGTFYPPNLTPDAESGIGKWTDYVYGEKAYLVLSLAAKSLLAWQIYFPSLD